MHLTQPQLLNTFRSQMLALSGCKCNLTLICCSLSCKYAAHMHMCTHVPLCTHMHLYAHTPFSFLITSLSLFLFSFYTLSCITRHHLFLSIHVLHSAACDITAEGIYHRVWSQFAQWDAATSNSLGSCVFVLSVRAVGFGIKCIILVI